MSVIRPFPGTETYTPEGLPFAKHGIPCAEVVFAAGRTAANVASHGGITEIRYFGEQENIRDAKLFSGSPISVFPQIFRPYVNFGGSQQYFLEFNDTKFWPFGYDSSCSFEGIDFRHRLTILPDAIVWELETDKTGIDFSLKSALALHTVATKEGRTFDRFVFDGSHATAVFTEKSGEKEYLVTSSSAIPVHFAVPINFKKDYFTITAKNGYAAFAVVFGIDESKAKARAAELDSTAKAECLASREEFLADLAADTKVSTGHPVLDSFISNGWGNERSMRVRDLKGGYIASNYTYWIWGWDSMAHNDALALMGHADDIYDRLCFYRDNVTETGDIPHAFNTRGKCLVGMHTAPQTIYTTLLYNYYTFTRDKVKTLEFYDFAATLLKKTEADFIPEAGLYKGMSLYPDYPPDLDQTGDDFCSFDNSILFQAFRSMAALARVFGKTDDAANWEVKADSLKVAYIKHFWDPEKHAFYDSVDVKTLTPRKYYPLYAILALTQYAWELTDGVEKEYAEYLIANHREKNGVSAFSRNEPVFYSDGIQLGMYMAVIEREYRRLEAKYYTSDSLLKIIERNWRDIEIAEAAGVEAVNQNEFSSDAPGKKQQFALNSWFSLSFEVLGGLAFSIDKLSVRKSPIDRCGWQIKDLKIGHGIVDIIFNGHGNNVLSTTLDNMPISATDISIDTLATCGHHVIQIWLN